MGKGKHVQQYANLAKKGNCVSIALVGGTEGGEKNQDKYNKQACQISTLIPMTVRHVGTRTPHDSKTPAITIPGLTP